VGAAIAREKQLQGWLRAKKIALIEAGSPDRRDLSADWLQLLRFAQDDRRFGPPYATHSRVF